MKCKYCQAELESNSSVCPKCGKDNLKDDLKVLKIVALVLICVVMLVLLAGLVCYGVTGSFFPKWGSETQSTDPTGTTAPETYEVITADGTVTMDAAALQESMDKVIATMGDYTMTNRELQMYYWDAVYMCEEEFDITADLSGQIRDEESGQTYQDYFLEEAYKTWQETKLMVMEAEKAGYEMPEDYVTELDSMEASMESYLYLYVYYYGLDLETVDDLIQLNYGPGCTFDAYYDYCYDYYLGNLYWMEMMEGLDVSDTEMEDYFTENEQTMADEYDITKDSGNLVDLRSIFVSAVLTEDEQEDWDATLQKIQEIYDLWLAGDKTEDSFAALATEHSEDTSTAEDGGLYTSLYSGSLALVDVRHILVIPEGGLTDEEGNTTYTDAEWAAALAEAQSILDTWLAGDKTEESFGELANEYSDDQDGEVTDGGIYEDIYVGQMVTNFEDWCFDPSRQAGDYGIVQTEYGYHIMYFVHGDREANDWAFDADRQVGDVGMAKTDDGYMLMYYVAAEPEWVNYCRYGVRTEKAAAMMEELVNANAYTVDDSAIVLGQLSY